MENKQYGTSVFDYVPETDKETIENEFFKKDEFDSNEIESMRSELKEEKSNTGVELKTTDALSGIKASNDILDDESFDEIDKSINAADIQGKTIPKHGQELIKSLLGEDATEDELKHISELLDTINLNDENHFLTASVEEMNEYLSDRMKKQFEAISDNNEDNYKNILSRFLHQIYSEYSNAIGYRDDISKLNSLMRDIKNTGVIDENPDNENPEFTSMEDVQNKLNEYMEVIKSLDDRNKKLKQDYTIDDIDTKLVDSVKQCLDNALSFKYLKDKVSIAKNKYRKDLVHENDVINSINNWIHSIKHDPHTLYTFPCNDYLTDDESRIKIEEFFFNTYLADICIENSIDIPNDEDMCEYLVDIEYIDEDDIEYLHHKAFVMLYVLSRAFKYNKVNNSDTYIRTLSYTLDIISKLGLSDHRKRFIEASDYVYDSIYE